MELDYEILNHLRQQAGNAFYILDEEQIVANFTELKDEFSAIYPKMNIAYSYKTNYMPRICKIIDRLGGYAEIVSDMEYGITKRIGVDANRVIFNGPYKDMATMREIVLQDGYVNIDSVADFEVVKSLVSDYPNRSFGVGIRCNFDVCDGVLSRFGVDVTSNIFQDIISFATESTNLRIKNLHCHFANRSLKYWPNRAIHIFELIDYYKLYDLDHIDLGGGLFGKMPDDLKKQFTGYIPTYRDYAGKIATQFAKRYQNVDSELRPELVIEPGSALVGDVMQFVTTVVDIKNIRGNYIATLLGSIYNINPTLNKKNPPISIYTDCIEKQQCYADLDFAGYTCIESDYMYRHFSGNLGLGDYVVFGNVGSYSIVLKPPFILPNFPVISLKEKNEIVKRAETFDDIFDTYIFK